MNATSTLIANLPAAGLATVTGGIDWVAYEACLVVAAVVGTFFPGLGSLIASFCLIPV